MVANASDLLRLILTHRLGEGGLRSTTAWASAVGLADLSDVALLYRPRQCGDWLSLPVGRALSAAAPEASRGRLIRIVGATTPPRAGTAAKRRDQIWRIHGASDPPSERFGRFELTDQHGGERRRLPPGLDPGVDRVPVVHGEIRIADRAHLQPDRTAAVPEGDADPLVRAGWRDARRLDAEGEPVDLPAAFDQHAAAGVIDQPIWIKRRRGPARGGCCASSSPPSCTRSRQRRALLACNGAKLILPDTCMSRSDDEHTSGSPGCLSAYAIKSGHDGVGDAGFSN